MIRYSLLCEQDHAFESWFRDSAAFEALVAQTALQCPMCGSTAIRKALMTPSVVTARRKAKTTEPAVPPPVEGPAPAAVTPVAQPLAQPMALIDERDRHMRELMRTLHQEIVAKADNVGRDFAVEARRIHEGETPQRSIYGEATRAQVEDLLEDGISLLPMPIVPDDHN